MAVVQLRTAADHNRQSMLRLMVGVVVQRDIALRELRTSGTEAADLQWGRELGSDAFDVSMWRRTTHRPEPPL